MTAVTVRYFVMMHGRIPLSLLIILSIGLAGCRKEKEDRGPVIEIASPAAGTTLHVPDTLAVNVTVTDDELVTSVRITLEDHNGIPIAPTIIEDVNAPDATLQRQIIVSEPMIAAGSYSLAVRASDGNTTTSAFRSVNVLEADRRLRAVFIVQRNGGSLQRIDSTGNVTEFAAFPQIAEAEVNSFGQHLYIASDPFSPLEVIATSSNSSSWQLQNNNTGVGHYFTSITTDHTDDRTYISSNDGAIRGYRSGNVTLFNAQAQPDFIPYANMVIGDRFLSEQRALVGSEARLVAYTYMNGAFLQNFDLDLRIVRMFAASDQHAIIFGNRNGEGVIELRNVQLGGDQELHSFPEGEIRSVAALGDDLFAVLLPDRVVHYDRGSNTAATVYPASADAIAFDKVNGVLFVGVDQELLSIDPATGAVINTLPLPVAIGKILPLFDR